MPRLHGFAYKDMAGGMLHSACLAASGPRIKEVRQCNRIFVASSS